MFCLPSGSSLAHTLRAVDGRALLLACISASSVAFGCSNTSGSGGTGGSGGAEGVGEFAAGANEPCDPLDAAHCLLPFPSDLTTALGADSATGIRVDFDMSSVPTNEDGVPIAPNEWNRNDGFSTGQSLLAFVPGLDLHRTWGVSDLPELERDHVTDIARFEREDAPILLIDTVTLERHPFFSETDSHPGTTDSERLLMLRPAIGLVPGRRYIVALRDMRTRSGSVIEAGAAFAQLRDDYVAGASAGDLDAVRPGTYRVLAELEDAEPGIDVARLYLAWDFTVGSESSVTARMLHIRDTAFEQLGDSDLADREVQGDAPAFRILRVQDYTQTDRDEGLVNETVARLVEGTVSVPYFLEGPPRIDLELGSPDRPQADPSGFHYADGDESPDRLPSVNPAYPTAQVAFVCAISVKTSADDVAAPMIFGHGLLGTRREATTSRSSDKRLNNFMTCGMDHWGLSDLDLVAAIDIVGELSGFPSIPDQGQQAHLNQLMLGRLLAHPQGLVADSAFRDDADRPLFDPRALVYAGYSMGGTMGASLTALAPDWQRGVVGVPAMTYAVILQRSVDWEDQVGSFFYPAYEGGIERQLALGLVQMLWDRSEVNGYSRHLTSDPLPNTPTHQLYILPSLGDPNTPNIPAELMARAAGASMRVPATPPGGHWSVDPSWGMGRIGDSTSDYPGTGDAYLLYLYSEDAAVPLPPETRNLPNRNGNDRFPHGDPQRDGPIQIHAAHWLRTGEFLEPCNGEPCISNEETRLLGHGD